jgi:hypothetical protein
MLFPGEKEAIETVKRLGEEYGYGNLIYHLSEAWSQKLQAQGMSRQGADFAARHICVWCKTDSRTGKKVKIEKNATPPQPPGSED